MKFRITSTSWDTAMILVHYPVLKDFGFEIEKKIREKSSPIRDENGQIIRRIYQESYEAPYITIDSMEKLVELEKALGEELIVSIKTSIYDEPTIEIYDGYRE